MKNIVVKGFVTSFSFTFAITTLAIICQFLAWEIGYIPAIILLIPGCVVLYKRLTKQCKVLVDLMIQESNKEEG